MQRWFTNTIVAVLSVMLLISFGCKKSAPAKKPVLQPLQALVNTDTTLVLYHRLILRANDAALLNDAAVTVLFLRNSVLLQAGYGEIAIDSMSANLADRIVRYNYLPTGISTDSAGYTPNPTLLGVPLYVQKNGSDQYFLNGSVTVPNQPTQVGKAIVYYPDSLVPPAADSLSEIVQSDSTLTYMSEVLNRTNLYDSVLVTGNYTLLAPSNTAFQQAGWDSLGAIDSAGIDTLLQLALNQVVKGNYFTNDFPPTLTTLAGGGVTVNVVNGFLQFSTSGNATPVHWTSGNQVAGPTLIMHRTDGVLLK
ncbi:MAG TPA: fasciclin domain-containing protein [Puia sp.]|nr:fasciclin domain-containing protein [Puia sp.]